MPRRGLLSERLKAGIAPAYYMYSFPLLLLLAVTYLQLQRFSAHYVVYRLPVLRRKFQRVINGIPAHRDVQHLSNLSRK
jgi:hypothetical protein